MKIYFSASGERMLREIRDSEKNHLFLVFITAFILRSIVVLLIYVMQGVWSTHLYLDDWKYETYALIYGDIASNIFDVDAMQVAGRQIGGIAVAQLYFRLNGVIYYLTNSVVVLRMMNVLFSSLTIFPVYLISKELFGFREGKLASWIFALLPYHIIMGAFLFKDILIVLLMSIVLYMIIKYYKYGYLNPWLFFLFTVPIHWLRDGIPLFLISILCLAFILRNYNKSKNVKVILWSIIPCIIIFIYIYFDTFQLLYSRFNIYFSYGRDHIGGINIIRIDSFKQIYKLPLTWFFSTFFPISFRFQITSWSELMGILNYTLFIISPAYIFFAIYSKKNIEQKLFFYPLLLLHLLVVILVINIPRHYYFLHFYIIICASAYLATLKNKRKLLNYVLIVLMLIITFLLFSFIKSF